MNDDPGPVYTGSSDDEPPDVVPAQGRWVNRVIRSEMVDADQLMAHPENAKIHPQAQQRSMNSVISRIGLIGKVIVNERTGRIIDGHMRVSMAIAAGQQVNVDYVNLTDEEERFALATYDPVGTQSIIDDDMFADLVKQIPEPDEALQKLFASLTKEWDVKPDSPSSDGEKDPGDVLVFGMVGWSEIKVKCTGDEIAALDELYGEYRADNGGSDRGFVQWLTSRV